jgi:hypothetical protein
MESKKPQSKSTKQTKKKLSVVGNKPKADLGKEERSVHVAVSAYYKAQSRGFEPGNELADWLAAEAEVTR